MTDFERDLRREGHAVGARYAYRVETADDGSPGSEWHVYAYDPDHGRRGDARPWPESPRPFDSREAAVAWAVRAAGEEA